MNNEYADVHYIQKSLFVSKFAACLKNSRMQINFEDFEWKPQMYKPLIQFISWNFVTKESLSLI